MDVRHFLIAAMVSVAPAAAQSAPATSMSPSIEADVRCMALNLIAAGSTDDDTVKQAGTIGTMYFLGKLRIEAPGIDLAGAITEAISGLQANPDAEEIGAACDQEIQQRGSELIQIGKDMTAAAGASTSS